LNNGQTPLN